MFTCLLTLLRVLVVLPRDELVRRLYETVERDHVLIQAPPGSGKTALVQLLSERYPELPIKYIDCSKAFAGINLDRETCWELQRLLGRALGCVVGPDAQMPKLLSGRVIILDNAQLLDRQHAFWNAILDAVYIGLPAGRVIAVSTVRPSISTRDLLLSFAMLHQPVC